MTGQMLKTKPAEDSMIQYGRKNGAALGMYAICYMSDEAREEGSRSKS